MPKLLASGLSARWFFCLTLPNKVSGQEI
uniref:Uncharacterized protein n=1 Tax=Arundo donax TaxID=35708 RepID=A0A0A9AHM5_ARUDO